MDTCTPTQLHHLFVYAVLVTFCVLGTLATLIAGFRSWRIGAAYLRECSNDEALCWAELRELRDRNVADEKRLREAMASYYATTTNDSMGDTK